MKINWQIITFAVMLIAVSCSKEKQTMNNGLVIEDIKIGDEEFKIGSELNETILEKFINEKFFNFADC